MSTDSGTPESWVSSFCSLLGHEYFAEISEDFLEDDFNLTGLQAQVPMYKEALEMILDVEPEGDEEDEDEDEEDEDEEEDDDNDINMRDENGDRIPYRRAADRKANDLSVIESSAELLYGLIHQRYITSRPGIQQMAEKYEAQHFGSCPRVFCNQARVLPVGCNDIPGQETVKLFCPSCLDVYTPPNSRFQSVDGAFFGTTFGCLFFMTFPDYDISAKGDPLNLSSTHSAYATPSPSTTAGVSTADLSTAKHSRSSSLTSTPITAVAPVSSLSPQDPSEPPLPPQPTHVNGVATSNLAPGLGAGKLHEPRIYGFRVSERSKTGPRMKWLRMRPADMNELDESRRWHELYGGNEDDIQIGGGGENGGAQVEVPTGRRKKAARSRKRGVGVGNGEGMNGGGGEVV